MDHGSVCHPLQAHLPSSSLPQHCPSLARTPDTSSESFVTKPQPALKTAFQDRVLILPQDRLPEPNLIHKGQETTLNKGLPLQQPTLSQTFPQNQKGFSQQGRLVSLLSSRSSDYQPGSGPSVNSYLNVCCHFVLPCRKIQISMAYLKHAINY